MRPVVVVHVAAIVSRACARVELFRQTQRSLSFENPDSMRHPRLTRVLLSGRHGRAPAPRLACARRLSLVNRSSADILRVTLMLMLAMSSVMTKPDIEHRDASERLEDLFRRHEPAVVAYVRRRASADVVDDIVAETFLVAWRRLDDVPDPALPWLLGVARRVLSTHRRGEKRRQQLGSRLASTQPSSLPVWSEDGDGRAIGALAKLPEKDREALMLVAWEGLTPQQAASVLGEPPVRFRVRLHRAKQRIKSLLEQPTTASPTPIPSSIHQGATHHD